jgi:peptidoglycan hydrolase CwlO-like protein
MAEINKLSVHKVLDKLRSNDAPQKSKLEQLNEKAEKMHEEIQRLRTATRRLKSGPRAGTTGRD